MAGKKSDRFCCPHCAVVLVKSPMASLLGEAGGFISFGSDRIFCPSCRGSIDALKMIQGDYDLREASGYGTLAALGALVGGTVLLHSKGGLGMGSSFLIALGVLAVGSLLVGTMRRSR